MERLLYTPDRRPQATPQEIIDSLRPFDLKQLQGLEIEPAKNYIFDILDPYYDYLQGVLDIQGPHGWFNDHTRPHHERVLKQTLRHLNRAGEIKTNTPLNAALAVAFHDIGGLLGRKNHPLHSAIIAQDKITNVPPLDLLEIIKAIQVDGLNPDELPANARFPALAAALNLADDLDIGRQRLPREEDQDLNYLQKDAHARLNYVTKKIEIRGDKNFPRIEWVLNDDQQLVSDLLEYSKMVIKLNEPKLQLVAYSWFSLYPRSTELTIATTDGRESNPILVASIMPNRNLAISLQTSHERQ